MSDVIVFAGTVEGRELSQYLSDNGLKVHACTATEYGGSLLRGIAGITVSSERLGDIGMRELFKNNGAGIVVDATHPYAAAISKKVKAACSETGLEYIRLLRSDRSDSYGNIRAFSCIDEAAEFLKGTDGNVLVTTGSKELHKFTVINGYADRVYARVLSLPDVVRHCSELGFKGRNLICMQGPFSEELNYGMIKEFNIRYIVTKDSGEPGGFDEKVAAAERAGAEVILIGRPEEDNGVAYSDAVSILSERFGISSKKRKRIVYVIGGGMGYAGGMTAEASEACRNADVVIGPKRMTEFAGVGKRTYEEFKPAPVASYIRGHPEYGTIAIVFSGDIGFRSGARKFMECADADWDIVTICGITSVQYLCGKLRVPWHDALLMSSHASCENIIGEIVRHGKVFSLLSKGAEINELCGKLMLYGMCDVTVSIGENMGAPNERIVTGTPDDLVNGSYSGLSVILAVNPSPDTSNPLWIPDEEFIRGDAPMTKSEVRSLAVLKLKLCDDSVVYDVGAGTGSVAVEMSKAAVRGKVYAIEMDTDALELIKKNKERFAADNMEIIEGRAPGSLIDLPVPTHAFIGGSSGELKEVLSVLIKKNPSIRMVINSVTLETVTEAHRCIKELNLEEIETICVSVSKSRKAGGMHLMMAQNPIYMITCRGKG